MNDFLQICKSYFTMSKRQNEMQIKSNMILWMFGVDLLYQVHRINLISISGFVNKNICS